MRDFIIRTFTDDEAETCLRCNMQELVRCKDCKHNSEGECMIKAGWFPVKPDWFCADGEQEDLE